MQLNSDQIKQIIPHRYPFLLVDRIVEMEAGQSAKGIKCVTANEPFFCGHFPEYAVMPGVLIIEALAQVGAVAILSLEEHKGKIALFGGIKNARFKRQVVPGTCWSCRAKSSVGTARSAWAKRLPRWTARWPLRPS